MSNDTPSSSSSSYSSGITQQEWVDQNKALQALEDRYREVTPEPWQHFDWKLNNNVERQWDEFDKYTSEHDDNVTNLIMNGKFGDYIYNNDTHKVIYKDNNSGELFYTNAPKREIINIMWFENNEEREETSSDDRKICINNLL